MDKQCNDKQRRNIAMAGYGVVLNGKAMINFMKEVETMCSECGRTPCASRCPNATEQTATGLYCESCGEEFGIDDMAYEDGSDLYCIDCAKMSFLVNVRDKL
ncbi:MAG: hypothetical protein RSC38_02460 [Oscillospiraceae bacterium]